MNQPNTITKQDRDELANLEYTIDQKYLVPFSLAKDLELIKDRQLYRCSHASFTQYCLERFGLDDQYFVVILKIGEVIEDLKSVPMKQRPCPSNYEQIQPFFNLTRLERIELAKCVSEVGETGLTVELIQARKLKLFPEKCRQVKDSDSD